MVSVDNCRVDAGHHEIIAVPKSKQILTRVFDGKKSEQHVKFACMDVWLKRIKSRKMN